MKFTETQEPEEEGERSENKKFIFKENFAVFSLENVDPSNFWKKNSTVERAEGDYQITFSNKNIQQHWFLNICLKLRSNLDFEIFYFHALIT